MQTIIVIFTDKKVPVNEIPSYKKYKFLCNYDMVSIYDMIFDPRYTGQMMVVGFDPCTDRVQQGMTLKDIYITQINGHIITQPDGLVEGSLSGSDFDIDQQRKDNMETRSISVTLEQAVEWYNSGNDTLRTLALNAYTKDELELNYDFIQSKVNLTCACYYIPVCEEKKFEVLAKLAIIANYYNKGWKKTDSNTGYYIGCYNSINGPVIEVYKGVGYSPNNTLQYAGVVYFKNQLVAYKAIKILGDEIKELFK